MAVDLFEIACDFFPGTAVADEGGAGGAHGGALGGIVEKIGDGLREGVHVAVADDGAAVLAFEFVEVAFAGGDDGTVGGEGLGDGHRKTFLVRGENEKIGINEGLPFFLPDELADAEDFSVDAVAADEGIDRVDVGGVACAGDGKAADRGVRRRGISTQG